MKQRKDYRPPIDRFNDKYIPEPNSGCWIWTAAKLKCGYGHFRIDGKYWKAHRASWLLFNGEIPGFLLVCHKCDNRICVNPQHLFLGTYKDNTQDCIKKGRYSNNVKRIPPKNKLTSKQIDEINELKKNKVKGAVVAKMYNVSVGLIYRAHAGKVKPKK